MHTSLYEHKNATNVRREWLLDGKAGNLQTLYVMRRIVRSYLGLDGGVQDNRLYTIASNILKVNGILAHDTDGIIDAVHRFVVQNVQYVQDPAGGNENIEHPLFALDRGFADCDGLVVLETTLLGMLGFETGFEAARYNDRDTDGYPVTGLEHVYGYATSEAGTVILDPTASNALPGWFQPGARERYRLSVTSPWDVLQVAYGELDAFTPLLGGTGTLAGFTIPGLIGAGAKTAGAGIQGGARGAIITGAAMAVSFVPVVGPILAPVVGLIASLFHKGPSAQERKIGHDFDTADREVADYLHSFNDKRATGELTGEDVALMAGAVQQLAELARKSSVAYVQSQWAMEEPNYKNYLETVIPEVKPGSVGTPEYAAAQQESASGSSSIANALGGGTGSSLAVPIAVGAVGLLIGAALLR